MALSKKKIDAIAKMVETGSTTETGAAIGVHQATVRRWFDEDQEFRTAYIRACEQRYRATIGPLVTAMGKAVTKLTALLDSPKTADVIRAAAVLAKINHGMVSHMILEQRLMALEDGMRNPGTRPLLPESGVIDLDEANYELVDEERDEFDDE